MIHRREFTALLAGARLCAQQSFTGSLWASIVPIFNSTMAHPFLKGLTDGSLLNERFVFYLLQDSLYLGAFARALSTLASRAPRREWAAALNRDAIESIEVESQMHRDVLKSYGVTTQAIASVEMAPVNYAYTNHLLMACERHGFAAGLAAVLPCYWVYWEAGKILLKKGSPHNHYQRWINQYASEEYGKTVNRVLAMMDEAVATLSNAEKDLARQNFVLSARYEYMFWDMAWRMEMWPPPR